VDINEQGLGYANKTICRKTLENGAGADCHLRRNAATPLGGNDLGLGANAGHQKGHQKVTDNKRADIIIGPLLLHSITQ
jgi:hypothetical protein